MRTIPCIEGASPSEEEETMGLLGKKIFTVAVGLLLATGIPHLATTAVLADPGCGCGCKCSCGEKADCGCEHGYPKDAGQAGAGRHGGKHGKDGAPMKERMAGHMDEMRGKIAKLRAIEAKMEGLKAKDDAAAFRAASLEHAKLLTDLQESHLKHMEGMMGGGK